MSRAKEAASHLRPEDLKPTLASSKENLRGKNQYTGHTHLDWLRNAVDTHNSDKCLEWPFAVVKGEYGRLVFQGRKKLAHRVAYFLKFCVWPMPCGRHECDNPRCVNPRHITPGTQRENVNDRVKRRRNGRRVHRFGEDNPQTSLTEAQVREMRQRWEAGEMGKSLAKQFELTPAAISNIVNRKRWAHI